MNKEVMFLNGRKKEQIQKFSRMEIKSRYKRSLLKRVSKIIFSIESKVKRWTKRKRKEGRVEGRKPTGRFGDVHTRPGYRTRPRLRSIQLPEYFVERSGVTTIIHESVIMHGNHTEPGRDAQPSVALLCNRLHPAMPEIKGAC